MGVAKLGSGSFGNVFKARCKATNVDRAVKSIEVKTVRNMQRFDREIAIAKQLDHPNVARLYETFREGQFIYLVMELCLGGELFDRIVDEAPAGFDEIKAAQYVRQMLSAICYLHAHNFAHRDVKPENFLFHSKKADSQLKLIDFGLASTFTATTRMTTKAGTAYYVAPEVLAGSYNQKCDVWSCGVIAFILLCGYPPFFGDTDPEILKKVKEGNFEFKSPEWDKISSGAKNIVTQMLTKDADLRPEAEGLLSAPWLTFKGAPAPGPVGTGFLRKLQSFQACTKLKKVALTVVATQLQDSDISNLQCIFKTLDTNGDGSLSAEEIRQGLQKQDVEVPEGLEDLLKSVDTNGNGSINYCEFLAATIEKHLYMRRDVLWSAFRTLDRDGDGHISKEELLDVLNGEGVRDSFGQAKVEKMIREVDSAGIGSINFEMFCAALGPSVLPAPGAPPARKRARTSSSG